MPKSDKHQCNTDTPASRGCGQKSPVVPVGKKGRGEYKPIPFAEPAGQPPRSRSRVSQVSRVAGGGRQPTAGTLVNDLFDYFAGYVVMPPLSLVTVCGWLVASHLCDLWDRFPHLAVTSPQRRCGKTRFLELLLQVCPKAKLAVSISPAALYRKITLDVPTLLLDEAQSLARKGSESTETLSEIFCGGISKDAVVSRCTGQNHTPTDFPIYCPKVVALIGKLGGALADRCIPVQMRRRTSIEVVRKARMREIEAEGAALRGRLEEWAADESVRDDARRVYDQLDLLDIENDRMAELLLPLQASLVVAAPHRLGELEEFAKGLDELEQEIERSDPGIRLLRACQEIFGDEQGPDDFFSTDEIRNQLVKRVGDGWDEYNDGQAISREKLATLLADYDIYPKRKQSKAQTARGYYRRDFRDAWERYLPPEEGGATARPHCQNPASPANPAGSAAKKGGRS